MNKAGIIRFIGAIIFVFVAMRVEDALNIPEYVLWVAAVGILIIMAIDYYWLSGKLNGGRTYNGKK